MTFARRDVSDPHEFDGRPPPHWIHNCPRCSHLVSRDEDASSHWRDIVARCTDPSHGTLSARLMNPCFLGISAITVGWWLGCFTVIISLDTPPYRFGPSAVVAQEPSFATRESHSARL